MGSCDGWQLEGVPCQLRNSCYQIWHFGLLSISTHWRAQGNSWWHPPSLAWWPSSYTQGWPGLTVLYGFAFTCWVCLFNRAFSAKYFTGWVGMYILLVSICSWNRTHDLGVVSTLLYQLPTGMLFRDVMNMKWRFDLWKWLQIVVYSTLTWLSSMRCYLWKTSSQAHSYTPRSQQQHYVGHLSCGCFPQECNVVRLASEMEIKTHHRKTS